MLLLLADLMARSSSTAEAESVLRELVEVTRDEPGNIAYAVHKPRDHTGRFLLYELYVDQAACEAHLTRAPVRAALTRLVPLLLGPPEITFCTTIATSGIDVCLAREPPTVRD